MKILGILFATVLISQICKSNEITPPDAYARMEKIQGPIPSAIPKEGVVPNAEVAIKIAEVVLMPIIGEKLKDQLPLKAGKKDQTTWWVEGRRQNQCPKNDKNCFHLDQSPAYLEIDSRDGRILKLYQLK